MLPDVDLTFSQWQHQIAILGKFALPTPLVAPFIGVGPEFVFPDDASKSQPSPMLRGTFSVKGTVRSARAYVTSLDDERRTLLEEHMRHAYLAGSSDGPRSFAATAWAVRGVC